MRVGLRVAATLAERALFARIERLARHRARKFFIDRVAESIAQSVVAECRSRLRAGQWPIRKGRDVETEVRRMVKWRVFEQLRTARPGIAHLSKKDLEQEEPVQFVSRGGRKRRAL